MTSWAVVDGDGRAKPAYFALRHAHADRLLTIQPRGQGLALVVVNDTEQPLVAGAAVTRRSLAGTVLGEAVLDVTVGARATAELALPEALTCADEAGQELLVAEIGPDRALWFFARDRDTAYAPQDEALRASAHQVEGGYRLDLEAAALVRDVAVLADRLDPGATVDDMLLTLLPGERASITVTTTAELAGADLLSREVLRSANQLVTDLPASQAAAASTGRAAARGAGR